MQMLVEISSSRPEWVSTMPTHRAGAGRVTPQLPSQATRLFDRTVELESIQRMLLDGEVRLLTLTGPAGVGKTRVAREVGIRLSESCAHVVVFIDLTTVCDPELVLARIAHALGLADDQSMATIDHLQQYLRERQLMLILDNFEQVLPAASLLPPLLASAQIPEYS